MEDNHPRLSIFNLGFNKLDDSEEVGVLNDMLMLRSLTLMGNPFIPKSEEGMSSYRHRTLFMLKRLIILDGCPVASHEKVDALNIYDPPKDVQAAVQHAALVKRQIKRYAKIKAIDLMQSNRLRPIVLCGPSGVGKRLVFITYCQAEELISMCLCRTLTQRLLKEFPHIFGLSVSHTTRKPRPGEEHGIHYYFVSKQDMENAIETGQFVETVNLFGHIYGTSFNSVDRVTEEGKVCLMDLEVEGVFSLKKSHLKPRYIFVTVKNLDTLQQRLHRKMSVAQPSPTSPDLDESLQSVKFGLPSPTSVIPTGAHKKGLSKATPVSEDELPPEIKQWILKAEASFKESIESKEFFDKTIVNDDLETAYQELKEYCLNAYLDPANDASE
jgi:guanylate kinase